jgi:hypothetical protein
VGDMCAGMDSVEDFGENDKKTFTQKILDSR